MNVLFINAAFRDGSRTLRLAEYYLQKHHAGDAVTRLELGENPPAPLDAPRLREYNAAVAARGFSGEMFDCARQFAQADVILIAAPFWNFGLPAVLSAYLELVCSQAPRAWTLPARTWKPPWSGPAEAWTAANRNKKPDCPGFRYEFTKKFDIFTKGILDKAALFIYNIYDYSNIALTFKEVLQ